MSAIRPALVLGLTCIALACLAGGSVHAANDNPDDMIKAGFAKLAEAGRLSGSDNENSEQDSTDAVRLFLAEYTDVRYAARLIFSAYWKTATPGQRERFTETFNNQVISLLVKFVADIDFASVRIEPFTGDTEETPLLIRVAFQTSDKQTINFDLVIHESEGRWLIFDVIAEGVSYVKTYRSQFTSEAADIGIEAMIERFEIRSGIRKDG